MFPLTNHKICFIKTKTLLNKMENEKPKYKILKEYIVNLIESEKLLPNEKFFSENELAEKFSISRHTVRQAIGELENEGLLYRVKGKGTFIRSTDKNKIIGVVTTYLDDYIFPSIIRGMDSVLSQNGYSYFLNCTLNNHSKERAVLLNLLNQNIDGVIIESTKSAEENPNIDLYEALKQKNIPLLFIHGTYKNFEAPFIVEDDQMAGFLAAEHLILNGHKRIMGIFKADDLQGILRYKGFLKAHHKYHVETCVENVIWLRTKEVSNYGVGCDFFDEQNYEDVLHTIKNCSGAVIYNEQVTVIIKDLLKQIELAIPQDISVVSFDDSSIAVASEPKLTTISHPKEKLGKMSANLILKMIHNEKVKNVKMKPQLIQRESVRRILNE